MSSTPSYTAKEIIRLLQQNGFVFDRASGSHQIYMLPDGSKRVIVPLHYKTYQKELYIAYSNKLVLIRKICKGLCKKKKPLLIRFSNGIALCFFICSAFAEDIFNTGFTTSVKTKLPHFLYSNNQLKQPSGFTIQVFFLKLFPEYPNSILQKV